MPRSVDLWIGRTDDTPIPPRVKDLRGIRFGVLTVLSFSGYMKNGDHQAPAWLCSCECGQTRRAAGVELRRGRIVSCGCKSSNATKDIARVRFGYWRAKSPDASHTGPRTKWVCECQCGVVQSVYTNHLISGKSQSCGCDKAKGVSSSSYKHGSNPDLYGVWCNMMQRCNNPNSTEYRNYGARGIKVCSAWSDFSQFEKDMGQRPSTHHTIERRDNSRGYEPGNCVWATRQQQARNKRNNRLVDLDGRKVTLAEACEKTGINYGSAKWRLNNGYDWRGI